MRLNALWWWIDRWRKSTAYTDMTLEEQGAYRNLLDEANLRGGAIPNTERILAKACGDAVLWPRVRENVLAHFELRSDGWHNTTLDQVIAEATRRAIKQARYRQTLGNVTGNTSGNEPSNTQGSPISDLRSPISNHQSPAQRRPIQGPGAGAGSNPRDHLRHGCCPWQLVEGSTAPCVPDFLHGQLLQQMGGDTDALTSFYRHVAHLTLTPCGDEPIKFWRTHLTVFLGQRAPIPKTDEERRRDAEKARLDAWVPPPKEEPS